MKSKFPTDIEMLMNMELGEPFTFRGVSGRELANLRGEIAYFFQGTLKANDNRLNDPDFPHDLSWDWRIEDSFDRNVENRYTWDLTVTKVETPDRWKYSGKELKAELERRELRKKLDDLNEG